MIFKKTAWDAWDDWATWAAWAPWAPWDAWDAWAGVNTSTCLRIIPASASTC